MSNDEPKLTVFVSSMIGPLLEERAAVEEAIRTGITLAHTWVFERTPASSEAIAESYLARVRECDVYLLILGDDVSDPVKDEYRTAVECGKPRLCFVQEGVERTEALEEFLPTLRADLKYATFSDEESLRREVLRAVRQELVEGYRAYRLEAAERLRVAQDIEVPPEIRQELMRQARGSLKERLGEKAARLVEAGTRWGVVVPVAAMTLAGIISTALTQVEPGLGLATALPVFALAPLQQLSVSIGSDLLGGIMYDVAKGEEPSQEAVLAALQEVLERAGELDQLRTLLEETQAIEVVTQTLIQEEHQDLLAKLRVEMRANQELFTEQVVDAVNEAIEGLEERLKEELKRIEQLLEGRAVPITAPPPRPPDYFVGRRDILDQLKAGLATGSTQAITALQGMGGIGKTATAQQLALEMEADFPGGVFWADMPRHGGDPSPVLAAWARLCGHDVASLGDPQAGAQAVRGMLGARLRDRGRLLVVLDDVREGWLEGAQTLKAALPPGVPLVLTTRDEELAYALDAEVRRLDALPMDDALALLSRLAGAEVVEAELLEARALAKRVGRLPLALELAGKLAARYARKPGWRLATLRSQIEAKAAEALKLRGHPGLAATFAVSYEALKEEQRRLFRWLGVFAPGPIMTVAVAGVLDSEEAATGTVLDELVGLSLVEWGEIEGAYRLHPLLADYAVTLLQETGEERAAREAHLAYYRAYARANARIDPAAHGRLEAELANLMAAAEWAAEVGKHQAVSELGAALYANSEFLSVRGYYREAVRLLTWSVAAAREIGDRRGEGNHLGNLGLAYHSLGQMEKAIEYHQQALAIAREIGDRRGEGARLGSLGNVYADLSQVEKAIEYCNQALEIAREIRDQRMEGIHLNNLGNAYADLSQTEKAIEHYQQALAIAREIGDRRMEGSVLGNLGIAYANLNQVEKAIEYHQQALAIAREIGDRRGEGSGLGNLGNVYYSLDQVEKAIEYHRQALGIAREMGDRQMEGAALGNLGSAYVNLDQVEKAIEYHQQALAIAREIGDRRNAENQLGNLGLAYRDLGDTTHARQYLSQALAIFEEIKSPEAERVRRWLAELD
jgi:tetratricopeptide (TPR) repeat protein